MRGGPGIPSAPRRARTSQGPGTSESPPNPRSLESRESKSLGSHCAHRRETLGAGAASWEGTSTDGSGPYGDWRGTCLTSFAPRDAGEVERDWGLCNPLSPSTAPRPHPATPVRASGGGGTLRRLLSPLDSHQGTTP